MKKLSQLLEPPTFGTLNPAAAPAESGLRPLTQAEFNAVVGGCGRCGTNWLGRPDNDPIYYAVRYWGNHVFLGTLDDLVWQVMN